MLNTGISAVLGVGFWLVAARYYSEDAVGRGSAAIAAMKLLAGLTAVTLTGALARFIPVAGRTTGRLVVRTYAASSLVVAVAAGVFLCTLDLWGPSYEALRGPSHGLVFVAAVVAWSLLTLQDGVLTGLRQAVWVPVGNTAFSAAKLALLIALAAALPGTGVFASWVVSISVSVLPLGWLVFRRLVPEHVRTTEASARPASAREIGRFLAGDYTGSLFSLAVVYLVPVLVASQISSAENAYFYIASTIGGTVNLLAINMGASLTVEGSHDPERLAENCRAALRRMAKLMLPVCGLLFVLAPWILGVFGPAYTEATPLLRWFAVGAVLRVVMETYFAVLRAQSRTAGLAWLQGLLCVLVLGLTLLLLPRMGLTGAGVAEISSLTVIASVAAVKLWGVLRAPSRPRAVAPERAAEAAPDGDLADLASRRRARAAETGYGTRWALRAALDADTLPLGVRLDFDHLERRPDVRLCPEPLALRAEGTGRGAPPFRGDGTARTAPGGTPRPGGDDTGAAPQNAGDHPATTPQPAGDRPADTDDDRTTARGHGGRGSMETPENTDGHRPDTAPARGGVRLRKERTGAAGGGDPAPRTHLRVRTDGGPGRSASPGAGAGLSASSGLEAGAGQAAGAGAGLGAAPDGRVRPAADPTGPATAGDTVGPAREPSAPGRRPAEAAPPGVSAREDADVDTDGTVTLSGTPWRRARTEASQPPGTVKKRTSPTRWAGLRWRPEAVAWLLLAAALTLYWLPLRALGEVNLEGMGGLGLVSVLPVATLVGAALLVVCFAAALVPARPRTWLLAAVLLATVVSLHAVPAVLEDRPRFATAWQHLGFLDYIDRTGTAAPDLDARWSWPGFFALAAFAARACGVDDLTEVLRWWPLAVQLLSLAPLALLLRAVRAHWRAKWTALWLFALCGWVGQDYFSPQSLNYVFYLLFVAVLLVWFRWPGELPGRRLPGERRVEETDRRTRTLLLGVLIALFAASVASHQLTPFVMLGVLTALVLVRRCTLRGLPLLCGVLLAVWVGFLAEPYWSGHFDELFGGLGSLGGNVSSSVSGRIEGGNPVHKLMLYTRVALAGGVFALAALGWWRRRRAGVGDTALAVLTCVPFLAFGMQSYGGEVALRVFLFAVPGACVLGALALFPAAGRKPRPLAAPLCALTAGLVLLFGFLVARWGNEDFERVRPGEVAAMDYVYAHDRPTVKLLWMSSDTLNNVTPAMPWGTRDMERVLYEPTLAPRDPSGGAPDLVTALRAAGPNAYLALNHGQSTYLELSAGYPADWDHRMRRSLDRRPELRRVLTNTDAALYELRDKPPGPADPPRPGPTGPHITWTPVSVTGGVMALALLLLLTARELTRVGMRPGVRQVRWMQGSFWFAMPLLAVLVAALVQRLATMS
ncbi:lipopolysaccharide biosynthesis protein [Streptomyces mobaraensis]|uniref:lipopolysaccharide biosynthesis protein n=2 Tax=Streptomyces TaxID=1883 RepID=UPI00163CE7AC|nr:MULTISPECIES: lipopolysaccharide biosynthesis protein [Streptomyces]MBC2878153.1 lipopolysaccharide biosynthesis protein [Streptomyces sp. TYQ1024]UBI41280.1 lipopolysaccharide biosynthesis protein [Streptomyces mobaraensis]UKW33780.1 lipopolysaccharide biosynthesis protein [Streptomyces sp. TYQ1024]